MKLDPLSRRTWLALTHVECVMLLGSDPCAEVLAGVSEHINDLRERLGEKRFSLMSYDSVGPWQRSKVGRTIRLHLGEFSVAAAVLRLWGLDRIARIVDEDHKALANLARYESERARHMISKRAVIEYYELFDYEKQKTRLSLVA